MKHKGIDDYLAAQPNSEEALQAIENTATGLLDFLNPDHRYEIILAVGLVEDRISKEILMKSVAKSINISVKILREQFSKEEDDKPVTCANFPGLVDLVTVPHKDAPDVEVVAFLIKDGDNLRVETVWRDSGVELRPPAKIHLPFILPKASAVQAEFCWPTDDQNRILFEDVLQYLKRFSYLEDKHWLIVACKVFLTYLQDHPDIYYLPMILFYAVPERGKSRTGKAAICISYRGVHVVDLREPNLFRYSENLRATIFFDLMDLWKKAEKNGAEDILLLRYEKGAKASRVIYPEKGPFEDMKYYDIFGPTLIATNEPLHKILNSRCIGLTMPNRPGDYEDPTPDKAQELRERLTAWRARVMDKPLPEVELIEGINGRLWDITKPLLQICKMVYPDGFNDLKTALLYIAGQRIEDKKDGIEGQIIGMLHELSPSEVSEWTIRTSEVLDKLNVGRPDDRKLSSQYIGKRLKAMGISTRKVHGYSEITLTLSDFNTLLIQYGFEGFPVLTPEKTLPLSTTLLKQGKLRGCQVESAENSTKLSTHETRINTGRGSLVESGRELFGVSDDVPFFDEEITG